MVLAPAASSPEGTAEGQPEAQQEPGGLEGLDLGGAGRASASQEILLRDAGTGLDFTLTMREYLIGAVAAEMPISWPDEALKAQAVACHSYILYCRDHSSDGDAWLSVDPARRQGCLTEPVLQSYWGTAYEENYSRLSAIIDQVADKVLCYDGAPAAASYFAISNGQTEASENVWDTALPYLRAVDSSWDRSADNFTFTLELSSAQVSQALASQLGISTEGIAPQAWFGTPAYTASGYVASLPVCGQTVRGTALRRALGLRSACFTVEYTNGLFRITTQGYGHGVGLSQWGAKGMAEQGQSWDAILAHYFPGTYLAG